MRPADVKPQSPRLAIAAVLTGAVAIGFAPVFVRLAETGPSTTAAWRVLMALPFLWLWRLAEQRDSTTRRPATAKDFLGLAAAGVLFVLDLGIWHWSLHLTTAANSTLLSNLAPVVVALGAWWLLDEKPTGGFLLGMALALAGAAMLVGQSLQFNPQHLRGDLLGLATAVFYAGYLLSVKLLRRNFSTATIMAWSGLVSGPGFALAGWLSGERMLPGSGGGWMVLAALAIVCHVGGQCLIGYGLGHLSAGFSALSLLVQPVVAALLAWPILGEPLGLLQGAGGIVILLGIATASGALPATGRRPAQV